MNRIKSIAVAATLGLMVAAGLSSCTDADIASTNISVAADNFEVQRRVVFIATTMRGAEYLLSIEGRCSLGNADPAGKLTVTCKDGPRSYKKHFLGLSDTVSYFVEQMEAVDVNAYPYRVTFKPQTILPDVDFKASGTELKRNAGDQ